MKIFAFYLPQYYPIPENDKFWGKGFTEWRNVASAKPLFKGHVQPKIPTDLGFYDLRNVDTMYMQVEAAKKMGINGFTFWHYWFGNGKRALEIPAENFLKHKNLDIEISFAWVNYNWTKSWVGQNSEVIFEQVYSDDDFKKHFDYLLPFFEDSRYTKVNNKPVLSILKPNLVPSEHYFDLFEKLASDNGFDGIAWKAPLVNTSKDLHHRFDYLFGFPPGDSLMQPNKLEQRKTKYGLYKGPRKVDFKTFVDISLERTERAYKNLGSKYIPTFMPNWDNTPRYKEKGFMYVNNTVDNIERLLKGLHSQAIDNNSEFLMIKSWNEWAEGNYLEPDEIFGNKIGDMLESILL